MDSTLPRKFVICVDFGMTGSAVVWRGSKQDAKWITIGKIPTVLAYDPLSNQGSPMAWGQGCAAMGADQVKQCFKAFIGSPASLGAAETRLMAPTSKLELHRWVRDYLHALCSHTADIISTYMGASWRSEDVIWNFSVPGRWSDYPVVADFKRLAQDALSSFLDGKNIHVEVLATEAEASAQSILSQGQFGADSGKYAVGTVVISCDIGGATTDVAISEIVGAGKLSSWGKLTLEPRGVVAFEHRFWEHTEEVLRNAGAQEPSKWALEITKSIDLAKARNEFSKSYGEVAIRLPNACIIEKWQPLDQPGPNMSTTIKKYKLCIPSAVFDGLLAEFVEEIEAAIDEAINVLRCEFRNTPAIIGLCGGGSLMLYLHDRLKGRYEPSISVTGPEHLNLSPDLVTSHGLGLIYEQRELSKFVSEVVFGIEISQGMMAWQLLEESPVLHAGFKMNSWIFTFAGKSRDKTVKHRIVAIPATSPPPKAFKEAYQALHSGSWVVEVELHHDDSFRPRSTKYTIVCSISRPYEIAFKAHMSSDGHQLSCRSTRL